MFLGQIQVVPTPHYRSPRYRWKGMIDVARPLVQAVSPILLVLIISEVSIGDGRHTGRSRHNTVCP
jgi:hypothetical protein